MPTTRSAEATWSGDLEAGSGTTSLATSGLGTFDLTWKARTEDADGKTSPEELIGAAHAGCFSMAFSHTVVQAGHPAPSQVRTTAEVDFVPGTGITEIRLTMSAQVEGVSEEEFQKLANDAKEGCPVSQALASVPSITLDATLA